MTDPVGLKNVKLFEELATQNLSAHRPEDREEALIQLTTLQTQHLKDRFELATTIIHHSTNKYAFFWAKKFLSDVILKEREEVPDDALKNCLTFLLWVLQNRSGELDSMATDRVAELIGEVVQVGWFRDVAFREAIPNIATSFIPNSQGEFAPPPHPHLWLRTLRIAFETIGEPPKLFPKAEARKVMIGFKTTALRAITEAALYTLGYICSTLSPDGSATGIPKDISQEALQLLALVLSFDFSSNRLITPGHSSMVMFPTTWTQLLFPAEQPTRVIDSLYELYVRLSPHTTHSVPCLRALTALVASHDSVYGNDQVRELVTQQHLSRCSRIMQEWIGVDLDANLHALANMQDSMKSVITMHVLLKCRSFPDWLQNLKMFTVKTFERYESCSNAIHHLLRLWFRLVLSTDYYKDVASKEEFTGAVGEVLRTFIQAHMTYMGDCNAEAWRTGSEPVALVMHSQLLEHIPTISRSRYDLHLQMVEQLYGTARDRYLAQLSLHQASPGSCDEQLVRAESHFAWSVEVLAFVLSVRDACSSNVTPLDYDCQIVRRVFTDIRDSTTDQSIRGVPPDQIRCSRLYLESGFLEFIRAFRKTFVTTRSGNNITLFNALEPLGMTEMPHVLDFIFNRLLNILSMFPGHERLYSESLKLLSEFCGLFRVQKLLIQLPSVQRILNADPTTLFTIPLDSPNVFELARLAENYFVVVGKLVVSSNDTDQLISLLLPLAQQIPQIAGDPDAHTAPVLMMQTLRSITGVISVLNKKVDFQVACHILIPRLEPIAAILESTSGDPRIVLPALQLLQELMETRQRRRDFPSNSATPVVLFSSVCQMLGAYMRGLASRDLATYLSAAGTSDDFDAEAYEQFYRPVGMCLRVMSDLLGAGFMNTTVFETYRDDTLDRTLQSLFAICRYLPPADVLAHPKLSSNYIHFAYRVAEIVPRAWGEMCRDPEVFRFHYNLLVQLLGSVDLDDYPKITKTFDFIFTWLETAHLTSTGSHALYTVSLPLSEEDVQLAQAFEAAIASSPVTLPGLLEKMLGMFVFDESLWRLARNIYPLILLLDEDGLNQAVNVVFQDRTALLNDFLTQFRPIWDTMKQKALAELDRRTFTDSMLQLRDNISHHLAK
eukprot:gnl/Dysnectes_brevis/2602_a3143_882.p1 GENE.gnl/Dysnectes_brevis/2602_a3143_882~~gnl/Dysnectes_brevis/2602_a3143_882.p1  ORF type:complete len:1119 (-),score=447.41 gnl/Dysnectes_brevis/2602_a3143_882:65-3421(-)